MQLKYTPMIRYNGVTLSTNFQYPRAPKVHCYSMSMIRRKISLIEGNAKCHRRRKFTRKGTLRQLFFFGAPEPRNPIPPPPFYILYTCIQYTYSHGRGEGVELNQRESYRGNSSQSWVENTNMTDCISSL